MLIVVDSTVRGPALGGCRWRLYPDRDAALKDAIDLAAAMTNKAALADLALGGGKAVVLGDPASRSREQLLAFGEFVDSLKGAYITAEDMGTSPEAMAVIAECTDHVIGLPSALGGCGDPSPHTAQGVRLAIDAALRHLDRELRGARVAVQGAGAVGYELVRILIEAGASVVAADTDPSRLAQLPEVVDRVSPEAVLAEPCDVFAPCGPPCVIDGENARELACAVVCGAANNPLSDPSVAQLLAERGILYVPDFLANAGGLIHLAVARQGGSAAETRKQLAIIPSNFQAVVERARAAGTEPLAAALRLARERLEPRG
jgi:leucine dehydrogenase